MKQRKLTRLKGYDYSRTGYYFVTICTKNRIEYFGKIENGQMVLNQFGEIVQKQWLWLACQYPYVILDEYVLLFALLRKIHHGFYRTNTS